MLVLRIILIIFYIFSLLHSIHFGLFGIIPYLKPKKEKKEVYNKAKQRYLFLIAARNEEMVLGELIDSIKKQNYPRNLYKICVLPNNCQDNTKALAMDKECLVLEPNCEIKTKGDVLNFAFNYFQNDNSFDNYIIFDADNILDPNYLKEIDKCFQKGYDVVQGCRDTKNLYKTAISTSYALYFYLQNIFLYETRMRLNKSVNVNGTGYAVSKKTIEELKFLAQTSTEDIEFSAVCAFHHKKVGYAKKAIFYDEQVENFKISLKQRKRWIQGNVQVLKKYYKNLFKSLFKNNSLHVMDTFYILTAPINQAICAFLTILGFILGFSKILILVSLIISYLGQVIISIFLGKYNHKNIKKMLPGIFFFGVFNLTWIPICIYALINSNNSWEEIKHKRNLKLEDIVKEEE